MPSTVAALGTRGARGRAQLADLDAERAAGVRRRAPAAGADSGAERGRGHAGPLGDLLLAEPALDASAFSRARTSVVAYLPFRHEILPRRAREPPSSAAWTSTRIVVGAGPAGLSAALMLGRARRRVLVLDSGEPRNHAARAHARRARPRRPRPGRAAGARRRGAGPLRDRGAPADVDRARRVDGGVEVRRRAGADAHPRHRAARRHAGVEGFDAIYGISAHTCPYCDGWEHRDARIAVFAPASAASTWARCCASGRRRRRSRAAGRGRRRRGGALAEIGVRSCASRSPLRADDGRLTAIELDGREPLERDALFFHVAMRRAPSSPPRSAASRRAPGDDVAARHPVRETSTSTRSTRAGQLRRSVAARSDGRAARARAPAPARASPARRADGVASRATRCR